MPKLAVIAFLVGSAGFAILLPGLDGYFGPEDQIHLANARRWPQVLAAFWQGDGFEYRPAFGLFLALQRPFFGETAATYYLAAFALHGLGAGLVYLLGLRLGLSGLGAGLAGLLVASHPAAAVVATWLGDQNRLAVPATVLAVLLWIRFREGSSLGSYPAAAGCLAIALYSKEASALLPFLFLACDAWVVHPADGRSRWLPLIPVSVLWIAAVSLAIRVTSATHHPAATGYGFGPHNLANLGLAAISLILPLPELAREVSDSLWPALGLAAGLLLGLGLWRSRGCGRFLLIWMVVALGPVLLRADSFSSFASGRYSYVALPPFALAVGAAASKLRDWWPQQAADPRWLSLGWGLPALVGLLLAGLAGLSWRASARSHYHPPGSVVYQYTVASLLGFADADAFLAARSADYGPAEWRDVCRWSGEILAMEAAADGREPEARRRHFTFVGHFAEGLARARLHDYLAAREAYHQARRLVSAPGELFLLRGKPIPNSRAASFVDRHLALDLP